MPRQPILTVLGHVDAGKTALLDSIRGSDIVSGESGGITQMIGATEIPDETLREICGGLLQQLDTDLKIPGLLFIDTPGHAAFSSLRQRGGSISDTAVLVVDIEEGIQPQTEEALEILSETETPFVVALNKIDTIPGWNSESKYFTENLGNQGEKQRQELDQRIYELMAEFDEHGFVIDRFDRIDDFTEKVAVVPTSAKTEEGVPELLMVLTGLAQNYLGERLETHQGPGKGTVLEVSEEKGFGTTIDVIQYDGTIRKTDTLVYGTAEGPKTTEIRNILKSRPLKEIREEKQFEEVEESLPAAGIKIAGKTLEGAVAGAPIRTGTNVEELKEEIKEDLSVGRHETSEKGVIVKADSLGSLEGLLNELEDHELNVSKASVGPVKREDIVEAENQEAKEKAVLAFNVPTTEEAREYITGKDVEVFSDDVIYRIIEDYQERRQEIEQRERREALEGLDRPAVVRTLQDHVFRSSNPVVIGVKVEKGTLTSGRLMNENGEVVGRLKGLQDEGESRDSAVRGEEVAASIADATLERDFDAGDTLYVDVPGEDYQRLRGLEDLLDSHELDALERIVEIKDSRDPSWKIG